MNPEMYRLISSDIKETAANCLFQIYSENVFSDMVLATNDGHQFPAHKVVLWWSSPVFRQLLERNPHERPLIYLQATGQEVLGPILQFLYTGECEVARDMLEKLMDVAKEFGIAGLCDGQDLGDVTLTHDDGLKVAMDYEEPLKVELKPDGEQQEVLEEILGSQRSVELETEEVCITPSVQEASFEMEDGIVIKSNLYVDSYDPAVKEVKVKSLGQNNPDSDSKMIKNADEFLKNMFLKKKQKIPLTSAERTRKYCIKKLLDPDHKQGFILQRREQSRKHRENLSECEKETLKKKVRDQKRATYISRRKHKPSESTPLPKTEMVSFTLLKKEK